MIQKEISLEEFDYRAFFGDNGAVFKQIISKCPNLKITSRGTKIKVKGTNINEVDFFEKKLNCILYYMKKYGHVSVDVVNQFFDAKRIDDKNDFNNREQEGGNSNNNNKDIIVYGNNGLVVRARSANQKKIIDSIGINDLNFAIGPAGTGKTYIAIAMAVRALREREVKKIILTRPAVEAGEKLGFLPGDMKDKLDPYLQPLYDALYDMVPVRKLEEYMETKVVQIVPLAYMRGRTLDNAFVILDEAQNATLPQLKMFLTRMGNNAKFIITGDCTQIDLQYIKDSGLERTTQILDGIDGVGIVKMEKMDIVRHSLVKKIVDAFERL